MRKRMKRIIYPLLTVLLLSLAAGCNKVPLKERNDRFVPDDTNPAENAPVVEGEWKIDTIVKGAVWKKFAGVDRVVTEQNQIVNVMEIDLTNPRFHVKMHYGNVDGLRATDQVFSNKRANEGAICCINGAYEAASCYIRTDYTTYCNIESEVIPNTRVRQWKSEACITSDGDRDVRIEYTAPAEENDYLAQRAAYDRMSDRPNIFSSAPMLVSGGEHVGETFVDRMIATPYYSGTPGMSQSQIERLDYENPIRHQGVTHPRTVVALTSDHKFLMITIDGRWNAAKGMSAKQVTQFITHHFPLITDALNMDGGGSTCMCILGRGDATNNVVNYPAQDDTFDHLGIRSVNSHFYVTWDAPEDTPQEQGE